MEIIITALIIGLSVFIFYRNVRKKASGKCECGDCGGKCTSCPANRR